MIECNNCGELFDYDNLTQCPNCKEYQNIFDEDYANGMMYPGSETYD